MAALRGENLDSREKLDALQQLCEQAFRDVFGPFWWNSKGFQELPAYARPKFLRILSEMDLTGTFKHQKAPPFGSKGF